MYPRRRSCEMVGCVPCFCFEFLTIFSFFSKNPQNDKNDAAIESWGGMSGLEKALGTSLKDGIKDSEVPDRQARFGKNEFPAPEPQTWLSMFLESF